ncbi:MAG: tRNA pseudouridine(13) synthase TruD [Campylobacter sp.]|nr:tRNA pseudouridine(13) synthase TruD [Campylobacter sp.]
MENLNIFKPLFAFDHSPIKAYFSKNSDDFVVREIPLYEFSGKGEHLVLHIQKKGFTTAEMLKVFSAISGAKVRDFGYAGLKDKSGMTTQYVTILRKFEDSFRDFNHENIKILDKTYHDNKLRIGHLKGNSFFIRLKKVNNVDALKLIEICKKIDKTGFPNYFGYQRFGKFGDNAEQGREILEGFNRTKNPKIRNFLISAYQSEIFNIWLSKRVELSKVFRDLNVDEISKIYGFDLETTKAIKIQSNLFKILPGDLLSHYPFGKIFLCENLDSEVDRFIKRDITVAGLLFGKRALQPVSLASQFGSEIYSKCAKFEDQTDGTHRFAWEYPKNLNFKYDEENAHFTLSFELDKGVYATTFLEEILHVRVKFS